MKYSITLQDLTFDEFNDVVDFLQGKQKAEPQSEAIHAMAGENQKPFEIQDKEATVDAATHTMQTAIAEGLVPGTSAQVTSVEVDVKEEELDADGLPWDERIHSSNKKKKKDGTWTRRRGLQDAEFDAIAAELKGETADVVGIDPASQPVQNINPPVTGANMATTTDIVNNMPVAQPQQQTPPPTPQQVVQRDFQGLLAQFNKLFAAQAIDPTYPQTLIDGVNQAFGTQIFSLPDIANNNEMVAYVWSRLEQDGKAN